MSKNIVAKAFSAAEPAVFNAWEKEFAQMHPNSFNVKKLNLINPIRRKYQLPSDQQTPGVKSPDQPKVEPPAAAPVTGASPKVLRPMFKPKPKIN